MRAFSGLLQLELRWFASADLAALAPSVRSVAMALPSVQWAYEQLRQGEAALTPEQQEILHLPAEPAAAGELLQLPFDPSRQPAMLLAELPPAVEVCEGHPEPWLTPDDKISFLLYGADLLVTSTPMFFLFGRDLLRHGG